MIHHHPPSFSTIILAMHFDVDSRPIVCWEIDGIYVFFIVAGGINYRKNPGGLRLASKKCFLSG